MLEDLKRSTGEEWIVRRKAIERRKFFKKEIEYLYQILLHLGEGRYQIVDLEISDFWYPSGTVAAYMKGYLTGLARQVQNAN